MTTSLIHQIKTFLEETDNDFTPPGSARTDLAVYAEKMARNAAVFASYDAGKMVAMTAIYCNDPSCRIAYMTLAAALPEYRRLRLVSGLIQTAIEYLQRRRFKILQLRIDHGNDRAFRLYRSLGFWVVQEEPQGYLMELTIAAQPPVSDQAHYARHC
ncbi:GNAT family N-acetyltransferase [Noviherbaspirillum sp. Root189]|uniref:GNAT family N-acetyltransferase n=1 Tax=Noviherbaspirillum sp. Root189 TaxID=1736487 RepID=UPI00070A29B5|nr:GNAT family N-acetyltransferase [Noviherbaspirillum sp. Root189]KRB81845.1 hypothetical protein ASE07_24175 [Noviherbaspirillum sp. Root189]